MCQDGTRTMLPVKLPPRSFWDCAPLIEKPYLPNFKQPPPCPIPQVPGNRHHHLLVPTKYLLEWAATMGDPLKEPLVSGLLPHLSSTFLFPTPSNFLPVTVPSTEASQNLPFSGND